MQDEDPKAEDQTPATEPVAEEVAPSPEPQQEQVNEVPAVEPAPEPIAEPAPPEPTLEPIPVPDTPPSVTEPDNPSVPSAEPEPQTPEPVVAEPAKPVEPSLDPPKPEQIVTPPPSKPIEQGSIPQKVLDLTPAELDSARRLWATQHIKEIQAKSAHDRTARKLSLEADIVKYVKAHTPATLSMIAYNMNISPRKASDYMIELVKSGKIQATGNTTNRRYS